MNHRDDLIKDIQPLTGLLYSSLRGKKHINILTPAIQKALQNIMDGLSDAVVIIDYEMHYIFANKKALQILGKTKKDVIGKKVTDVFPLISGQPMHKKMIESMQTKKSLHHEYFSDSVHKWFSIKFHPSRYGLVMYYLDIDRQK